MNTGKDDPYSEENLWAYRLPDDYEPREETSMPIDPSNKPYSGAIGNTDMDKRGLGISDEYRRD